MVRPYGRKHYLTDEQSKLAGGYIKFVWWYLRKFAVNKGIIKEHEMDDCSGYLMWHLCMAAEGYDPNRDNEFTSYAIKGMRSGLHRYLELKNKFNKHIILTDFRVTRRDKGEEDEIVMEPEYIPQNKRIVKWEDIEFLFEMVDMNPLEQQIVFFYHDNRLTFQEIGDLIGKTRERVRQIYREVIDRIKEEVKTRGIKLSDFEGVC